MKIMKKKTVSIKEVMKKCKECKHCTIDGDDFSNWGYLSWWQSCEKTSYDNLKSFPFKNTKCKKYENNLNQKSNEKTKVHY